MKTILKYSLILGLMIGLLPGCSSHLDVPPVSSITSAGYWKGEDDAVTYLFGIYNSYRGLVNTDLYSETRADLLENGPQVARLGASYQHTLAEGANGRDWKSWYTVIHHCNLLLYQLEISDLDLPDVKAQALGLRALSYFSLVRIFGDVPLNLDPTLTTPSNEGLERSAAATVMAQIKADIEQSISLFTSDGISDRNMLSKAAALAAKADIMMWSARVLGGGDAEMQSAIEAINQIESSSAGVALLDTYSDIFDVGNENNGEIIFSMYFDEAETGSSYFRNYGLRQDFLGGVDAINELYPGTPHSGNSGLNTVIFSRKLEAYYDEHASDVRKAHNCYYVDRITDGERATVIASKFIGTWDGTNRIYDNDLIQYRWADLVLMRAEAYNSIASRDVAMALADLNLVRNRAGIGDYIGAQDAETMSNEILKERARELCYENKRWEDLIRAGKVPDELENYSKNRGTDLRYIYWPISLNIMAQNPKLVQTDGY